MFQVPKRLCLWGEWPARVSEASGPPGGSVTSDGNAVAAFGAPTLHLGSRVNPSFAWTLTSLPKDMNRCYKSTASWRAPCQGIMLCERVTWGLLWTASPCVRSASLNDPACQI